MKHVSGGKTDPKVQLSIDSIRAYKDLFSTPDGQTVLYDLLDHGFFMKPTYDPSPEASLRNEGKREMCLRVLEKCNISVDKVLKRIENGIEQREEYFN